MHRTDAWDQVDPDGPGPTLIRPRRTVPGGTKRKETLAKKKRGEGVSKSSLVC